MPAAFLSGARSMLGALGRFSASKSSTIARHTVSGVSNFLNNPTQDQYYAQEEEQPRQTNQGSILQQLVNMATFAAKGEIGAVIVFIFPIVLLLLLGVALFTIVLGDAPSPLGLT